MSLNIEVLPRIPAKVTGTDGITVVKSNGSMVIGFDYETSGFGAELQQAVDATAADAATTADNVTAAEAAQTGAEVAQAAAEAAAGSLTISSQAEAEAGTINDKGMSPLRAAQSIAARAPYDDVAAAEAATVPADREWIQTLGMDALGNEAPATWKEVSSAPSHGAYLTDAGGRLFEIWVKATPPNIMQFGGSVYSADDNTPALLKMLKYCQAKGLKWAQLPGTGLVFKTWPGELGQYGDIYLEGAGRDRTKLYMDYDEATSLRGFLHWETGRPKLTGMTLLPIQDRTGGCALTFQGNLGTLQPDVITLDDIRITSGTPDGWVCGVNFDGSAKDTSDGFPRGLRNTMISNLELFGCSLYTARIISVRNFNWHGGVSISDTGGGAASGDIFISGVNGVESTLVRISMNTIAGDLILDEVDSASISFGYIGGTITNTTNTNTVKTDGRVEVKPQSNWIDSRHDDTVRNGGTDGTWTWRDLGNGELEVFRSASLTTTPTDFTFPAGFGASGSFGVAYYGFSDKPATVTAAAGKVTASAASSITCKIGARGRV